MSGEGAAIELAPIKASAATAAHWVPKGVPHACCRHAACTHTKRAWAQRYAGSAWIAPDMRNHMAWHVLALRRPPGHLPPLRARRGALLVSRQRAARVQEHPRGAPQGGGLGGGPLGGPLGWARMQSQLVKQRARAAGAAAGAALCARRRSPWSMCWPCSWRIRARCSSRCATCTHPRGGCLRCGGQQSGWVRGQRSTGSGMPLAPPVLLDVL